MVHEWLRTPESDAPVPDFVERDLERPFEINLSEWAAVEPLPDFAERVVRAIDDRRSRGRRGAQGFSPQSVRQNGPGEPTTPPAPAHARGDGPRRHRL